MNERELRKRKWDWSLRFQTFFAVKAKEKYNRKLKDSFIVFMMKSLNMAVDYSEREGQRNIHYQRGMVIGKS